MGRTHCEYTHTADIKGRRRGKTKDTEGKKNNRGKGRVREKHTIQIDTCST